MYTASSISRVSGNSGSYEGACFKGITSQVDNHGSLRPTHALDPLWSHKHVVAEPPVARADGVLVEAVQGPAEKTQIRRGDVIIAVDNTELTSIRQFSDIVAQQKPGTPLALLVRRADASLYVAVEVGAS